MRCMPVIPVLGGLRQEDYDGVGGQSGIHNEMLSEVNKLGWERSSVGGMFTQHARMHAALGFIWSHLESQRLRGEGKDMRRSSSPST